MRKKAASLPRLPPDARAKGLAHAEAAISANGLTHLVIGVYVLISAAVWWFGAYKEFNFGHGPNGEDVWQRWPIAYVFFLRSAPCLPTLAQPVSWVGTLWSDEGEGVGVNGRGWVPGAGGAAALSRNVATAAVGTPVTALCGHASLRGQPT